MSFPDELKKAVDNEKNGKITREELLSKVKQLFLENDPNIPREALDDLTQAAIDPMRGVAIIGGEDGPTVITSGSTLQNERHIEKNGEPVWIYDRFTKAIGDFRDGNIGRSELLEKMTAMAAEANPKLSSELVSRLGEAMTDAVNCDNLSLDHNKMARQMPDGFYELPDLSALQVGAPKEKKMDISPEVQAKCDKLLARVDELIPPAQSVRLKPSRGETTVFCSKMGGVPYFPKSMKYPTVIGGDSNGEPLRFLAQLNFEELPKLPGFPTEGILQFFAGYGGGQDDVYGLNFEDGQCQNTWRVVYHEKLITDASLLISEEDMPEFDEDEDAYPFVGEFRLTAEKAAPCTITMADFRFNKAVAAAYNELFGGNITGMYDSNGRGLVNVDEPLYDAVSGREASSTCIGGYPFFMQDDPRGYNENYAKCTVLLFQSDSESGGDDGSVEDEILWGDCGVANFFITPEDLAKRDFSNVLYTWDCG